MIIPRQRPASLTLDSTVAYCDDAIGIYYERCCIGLMPGKARPASLREVAPLDPGCRCGVHILGQAQLWWGKELLRRETEQKDNKTAIRSKQ